MGIDNFTQKYILAPTSIAPLVTFRIVFGLMTLISSIRFVAMGWVKDHFIDAKVNFKYYGFEWVKVLSPNLMYIVYGLMIIASFCILIGAFYRIATITFFLTFVYTELIDITYYLNHYYFVSIVAFLMIFVPANRKFSFDVWRNPHLAANSVPAWCINIFKLQLAIVYVFAGVIKINYDWLINALPLKIWLPANDSLPLIGWFMKYKFTPYLFSWAGMLYDSTIILWLILPKTRLLANITVIIFHIITGLLFQIGVFPMVMIGATLIFFSEKWHERFYPFYKEIPNLVINNINLFKSKALIFCLFIFFGFQLLFPWRFLLYPGNMFWTEQGYRFGWRVMLMEKAGTATFYVKDAVTGREGDVVNSDFLCSHQEKQMAMQPDLILQYAHFLKVHFEAKGMSKPAVRAEVYVTLNGKPSQLLFDQQLDISKIKDSWANKKWIFPYEK
jgi:Vitamin K-dependent gamma-carboxylase